MEKYFTNRSISHDFAGVPFPLLFTTIWGPKTRVNLAIIWPSPGTKHPRNIIFLAFGGARGVLRQIFGSGTPQKSNIETKNDALEKCISFQTWLFWVSMLVSGRVNLIQKMQQPGRLPFINGTFQRGNQIIRPS